MFWTENNSQILLFEAGVLTIAIPASPDTHATSEIECLKKNPHKNIYHEPQNFLRKGKKSCTLRNHIVYLCTAWF